MPSSYNDKFYFWSPKNINMKFLTQFFDNVLFSPNQIIAQHPQKILPGKKIP